MHPLTIRKLMILVLQAALLLTFFVVVLPLIPGMQSRSARSE